MDICYLYAYVLIKFFSLTQSIFLNYQLKRKLIQ